ncbi:hypothetical protein SKAU_G00148720 [Synaphobranchus kaupii]|uniref:Uncharacterized protein n=1 Tax=Synaphobranchus kaupii TaxID=118154 RepID=A0A9Q1FTL8_SYNKA|nr:hypothetical protein SKAU_G00148720 [Synaphobranchus kaupii]
MSATGFEETDLYLPGVRVRQLWRGQGGIGVIYMHRIIIWARAAIERARYAAVLAQNVRAEEASDTAESHSAPRRHLSPRNTAAYSA